MRQDKHLLLDEVTESIKKYENFFVMRYKGMTANMANVFRGEVVKRGGDVHILRKRLLLKAAESIGLPVENVNLDGHVGLVFAGNDPVEMSKTLIQFGKDNNEAVTLVGARVENQMLGPQEVITLSQLPGKNDMRAQLLATFEAPMSQTLAVMEALIASVVYCLDNKCTKESGEKTAE